MTAPIRAWLKGFLPLSLIMILSGTAIWQWRHGLPDLALAQTRLDAGEAEDAVRIALDRLVRTPGNGQAARIAAIGLCKLDFPQKALPYFEQAEATSHLQPDDRVELAKAQLRAGHMKRAEETLLAILADEPDLVPALTQLAALYHFLGRNPEALEVTKQMIGHPEGELFALGIRSMLFHEGELAEQAAEAGLRLLELDPDLSKAPVNPEVFWSDFATDLITIGQSEILLERLEVALARTSSESGQIDVNLLENYGRALRAVGRTREAKEAWEQTIALDSDRFNALLGLGQIALQEQKPDEALFWLEQARQLDPGSPTAYYDLSLTYFRLGRVEDARASLDKFEALRKENPTQGGMGFIPDLRP